MKTTIEKVLSIITIIIIFYAVWVAFFSSEQFSEKIVESNTANGGCIIPYSITINGVTYTHYYISNKTQK